MTLEEAFSLKDREVISLVGGGGKTTLMFSMGKELSSRRKGVLLTTTTKIWAPTPSASLALFLSDQFSEIKKWVAQNLQSFTCLLVAQERLTSGKLKGINPEWIEELHSLPEISVIIVEADGAAGRSLKAPREGEPVVPQNTSLLIPVVGIDVLGSFLDEQHVFRSEIAARLLHKNLGSTITEEDIARLVEELVQNSPEEARVIPFVNKVDLPSILEKGRKLAKYLLDIRRAKISRVILGQACCSPVVKETISHNCPNVK